MTDDDAYAREMRETEAMAKRFREATGRPIFLAPALYDKAKRMGMDMSNFERNVPMPLDAEPLR